jgi:hypothetical protein
MYSVGLDELLLILFFFSKHEYIAKRSGIATFYSEGTTESIDRTKEILFGSILGDGKIELPPIGINARFGFTQAEGQKDYFISVCNSLSTISSAKYREYTYVDKRTGKTYKSLNL